MDTHIASHPELGPTEPAISARLPGEVDYPQYHHADMHAAQTTPPTPSPRPAKRRRLLLASGAVLVLIAAVGVGGFLISSYNTVYPVPRLDASVRSAAASMGVTLPSVLAPSAALASVQVPPRPEPTRDAHETRPRGEQMAEVLSLHPGMASQSPRDTAPVTVRPDRAAVAVNPVSAVPPRAGGAETVGEKAPSEPGMASAVAATARSGRTPLARDGTAAVLAAITQATTQPGPSSSLASPQPATQGGGPAPAVIPPDASSANPSSASASFADAPTRALELRPAPMAPAEQIQVLELVTEMGTMVRDLSKQDAQMRADFTKAAADTAVRLRDYERRLAVAEARQSVSGARQALRGLDDPAATASVSVKPAETPPPVPAPVIRAATIVPAPPTAAAAVKAYRVQAASPGLALLAQVDRGGGEGAQIQVVVGDTIPDWGRVKSISQKGTAWVVLTDRGPIASQ